MGRGIAITMLTIILLVIFLPAAVVSITGSSRPPGGEPGEEPGGLTVDRESVIRLYRVDQNQVLDLELEEYLIGVVAAEMPASFEMEALKAQAVSSRTYTWLRCRDRGGSGCELAPEPADVCSDSTHCQAWLDPEELNLGWPEDQKEELLDRIKRAVRETKGQVVTYNGELIDAVYHSTCGGLTESSHALWGGVSIPYLQPVTCPYCAHSPSYRTQNLISYQALADVLPENRAWPVTGGLPLEITSQTPGGRVATLKIDDFTLEGKELRRLFQLPSLACSFQVDEQGIRVNCKGKGHGVGLCQYGADGAAAQGKTYHEIISFYYGGANISLINP